MLESLKPEELQKKLEELIAELIKEGKLKLSPVEIRDLAKQVTEILSQDKNLNISQADLFREQILKTLKQCCLFQYEQKLQPELKFDYTLLFKKQTPENKKALQEEFLKLLMLRAKFDPQLKNQLNNPLLKKHLQEVAKILVEKNAPRDDEDRLLENEKLAKVVDAIAEQLRQQRVQFYGKDTHTPGGYEEIVQSAPQGGNAIGAQDLETATTPSFMGQANSADYGTYDPLGLVMAAVNRMIATNSDSYNNLEQDLVESGYLSSSQPSPYDIRKPSPFR